jgi:hypothetical protein
VASSVAAALMNAPFRCRLINAPSRYGEQEKTGFLREERSIPDPEKVNHRDRRDDIVPERVRVLEDREIEREPALHLPLRQVVTAKRIESVLARDGEHRNEEDEPRPASEEDFHSPHGGQRLHDHGVKSEVREGLLERLHPRLRTNPHPSPEKKHQPIMRCAKEIP